jgi:hypothetical protein|nr:hypothetical protein [Pseudomonas fluorescens]
MIDRTPAVQILPSPPTTPLKMSGEKASTEKKVIVD